MYFVKLAIEKNTKSCSQLAETLAFSDAVDNGVYLTKVLSELLFNDTLCIPMEVVTDSKTLYITFAEKCIRKISTDRHRIIERIY